MENNDCKRFCETCGDYLDGEMEQVCCEEFETHMKHCLKCEIFVRTTRTTIRICQEHIREEIPDAIRMRVRRVIMEKLIQEKLCEGE